MLHDATIEVFPTQKGTIDTQKFQSHELSKVIDHVS